MQKRPAASLWSRCAVRCIRMDRAWILLGMMGSGKSSVGRRLAELAEREFKDTDQLLQYRLGRPIGQLFDLYGEEAFRSHENHVLRDLSPGPYVLATGGGIVLREDNWGELRRLGTTIHIKLPPETLTQRLAESKRRRPLLEVENWEERLMKLISARADLYAQADLTVEPFGLDVEGTARAILMKLQELDT